MADRSVLKWAGVITVLLLLSRLTGFFRELAIAYRFGASAETDAYLVAVTLPQLLFFAVNDAVKTSFIPVFGEYHKKEDGSSFAFTVYVILGGLLFAVSVVLVMFAPWVVRVVAPGFADERFGAAVTMSRILLPGLMFMGLTGLSSGVLHTKKNFVVPALTGFPNNAVIILTALLFGVRYGIVGLAWGTLVGFSGQFLIQVPAVAGHGVFRGRKVLWRHPGLKKMGVLLPPVILGGAAVELKGLVDRVFGSWLPEGSIAALNFANRLYLLPNGILIIALLTVLYPTLVEYHVEGKVRDFKETFRQGAGLIILLVLPMMVGLILLREPVVRVLFERGRFDAEATANTAYALGFYGLGLLALGLQLLMYRAFYAMRDTLTPMIMTMIMVVLNILFNWLLIGPMAHGGIALGTALALNIGTGILGYLLWRKIGNFGGRQLFETLWKSGVAAAGMGVLLFFGRGYLAGGGAEQVVMLGVLIGTGGLVYFGLALLLRVSELDVGLAMVRRKLKR